MDLNRKSRIPLHKQAEDLLRELIDKPEYKRGKLLPNEVDLAAQWHISRNTLRQAINQLVFEGLLVRKNGVGTKVAIHGITSGVQNWRSFSQEMKMLGVEVKNYELRVSFRKATAEVAAFFGIDTNTLCVVMERIRGSVTHPFVSFTSYFNPRLPLTGNESFTLPLYDMLEQNFGVVVKTSKEEISARLAGEKLASKLEIAAGDPILVRKRFVLDVNDVPVEYNVGYYRADSFTYSLVATR